MFGGGKLGGDAGEIGGLFRKGGFVEFEGLRGDFVHCGDFRDMRLGIQALRDAAAVAAVGVQRLSEVDDAALLAGEQGEVEQPVAGEARACLLYTSRCV